MYGKGSGCPFEREGSIGPRTDAYCRHKALMIIAVWCGHIGTKRDYYSIKVITIVDFITKQGGG